MLLKGFAFRTTNQESSVHKIRNNEIKSGESILIAATFSMFFLPLNAPKIMVTKKTITNFMMNGLLESNTFSQLLKQSGGHFIELFV